MRALAIDHGERRIGVAISDESRTLARPLTVLNSPNADKSLDLLVDLIERTSAEDGSLDLIVVGLPVRLDGTPNDQTARVKKFVERLTKRTAIRVVTADERLSSREAESRLAVFHKSWRERKATLDAAAAAVILQDYLDSKQG